MHDLTSVRSWSAWFQAAEQSGLDGQAWLDHWWHERLPALVQHKIRWEGPVEIPNVPWDVSRWGDQPRKTFALIDWDRRCPHSWQEALAWGMIAPAPRLHALRHVRGAPPSSARLAVPSPRARQWYRLGLRFSSDDTTFWLDRMKDAGGSSGAGLNGLHWCYEMGQIEGPLRAALEIGKTGMQGVNQAVAAWWACFEQKAPHGANLHHAPYVLAYLLRQEFEGAEHWRERLLAGTSSWEDLDGYGVLAVAHGASLSTLSRPWALPHAPVQASAAPSKDAVWTFAHACSEHFQREVQRHEVILPVDVWWWILKRLDDRQAPLFHAARCPRDGALVSPWEEARRRAEDPSGSNHRALFAPRTTLSGTMAAQDPAVKKSVLERIDALRHQEALMLRAVIQDVVTVPAPLRRRL